MYELNKGLDKPINLKGKRGDGGEKVKVVSGLVWDTHMKLVPHPTIQKRLQKEVRTKGDSGGKEEDCATF